jgi:hypothetical protein
MVVKLFKGGHMKAYLIAAAMCTVFFGLTANAHSTTIQYVGQITRTSGNPTPYGEIGDRCDILVDYDPVSMAASEIIVTLEAWGPMWPTDTRTVYFRAPDDWCYNNTGTQWLLSGGNFELLSDNFGGRVDAQVTAVPEPSALVMFGLGMVGLAGAKLRRKPG